MKIRTLEVGGFHPAMVAMRLPMKSGDKSDSGECHFVNKGRCGNELPDCTAEPPRCFGCEMYGDFAIGPKDHELSMKLIKAGSDHRKHLRLIDVWAEIQAPEYFFAQLATYRFGVDSVSSSLMHRGLKDEFTIDDFEVTDEIKQMLTPAAHENGSHLIYGDSNEYKIYRCGDRDYRVYASGKIVACEFSRIDDGGAREKHFSERQLKPSKTKSGYFEVNIGGKKHNEKWMVHRLVAEVWMKEGHFEGAQINHIDGNKGNNSLDNLEWVTRSENMQHAWNTGLCEKTLRSKYTAFKNGLKTNFSQRLKMRDEFNNGASIKDIASAWDLSYAATYDICLNIDRTGNKDAYEQALLWELTIERLNRLRESGSIETLRSAIPGSYQYTRIYKFSYEALRNIYHARKNHKLKQWHVFCDWIETLPYSEFITEPAS